MSEGFNMSTIEMIIIGVGIILIGIVTLWLNSKINAVRQEVEPLKNDMGQMKQIIDNQNRILGNIMQTVQPEPSKKKQSKKNSTKNSKKRTAPPVPPSPSSSDDDEFDDEDLNEELQNASDDGTLSSADEEIEVDA